MKLSRIKLLLFDEMLLIYSSCFIRHVTRSTFMSKTFSPSVSEHDAGFMNIINVTVVQSVSVHAHLVARTHEVVTDGSHHHYGNRVSSIDSLLPRRRLDEVWTCRVGTDEMSSTKAGTEVTSHRSAVGFVRRDDKQLEAGVPVQVDCTDSVRRTVCAAATNDSLMLINKNHYFFPRLPSQPIIFYQLDW